MGNKIGKNKKKDKNLLQVCDICGLEHSKKICLSCEKYIFDLPEIKGPPTVLSDTMKCGTCGKPDGKETINEMQNKVACFNCDRLFCDEKKCFPQEQEAVLRPLCHFCTYQKLQVVYNIEARRKEYVTEFIRPRKIIYPTLVNFGAPVPLVDIVWKYYHIHCMEVQILPSYSPLNFTTSTGEKFEWESPEKSHQTCEQVREEIAKMFKIEPNEIILTFQDREIDSHERVIRKYVERRGRGRPFADESGYCSTSDITTTEEPVSDWSKPLETLTTSLDLDKYTVDQREWLGKEWSKDGLAEHASIGSFSRHILELLAVGAPSTIITEANRALGDEIIHSKLCFFLASQFSGIRIEPTQFPIKSETMGLRTSIKEMAIGTVLEGCVEETIAAICAFATLFLYPHGKNMIYNILERIVMDEIRHAALSWKTLIWACEAGGKETRDAVRTQFTKSLTSLPEEDKKCASMNSISYTDDQIISLGRLPDSVKSTVSSLTVKYLIQPWSDIILEGQLGKSQHSNLQLPSIPSDEAGVELSKEETIVLRAGKAILESD